MPRNASKLNTAASDVVSTDAVHIDPVNSVKHLVLSEILRLDNKRLTEKIVTNGTSLEFNRNRVFRDPVPVFRLVFFHIRGRVQFPAESTVSVRSTNHARRTRRWCPVHGPFAVITHPGISCTPGPGPSGRRRRSAGSGRPASPA